jgi:hypothetical protein
MKKLLSMIFCAAAALPLAAGAQVSVVAGKASAPGARGAGGEIQARAKVVELDSVKRTATLRAPDGRLMSVDVPAEVKNFDQVRVGDDLVVRYVAAAAARIEPAGKSGGIRERIESTSAASAPAGALPGTGATRTVEVLAVIQAVDRKAGTVTLRGAKRTITVKVPQGVDAAKLKVGDEVRAVLVEAAVLSVERAPVAAVKK